MSVAAHSICPNYNRCNKYLEFTLKLDAYEERDRRKDAVIAAQAKRIAELEAMLNGGDSDAGGGKEDAMPKKPFGSSTPSSKIPIKPNSEEESRRRRGGRPPGHEGAGRTSFSEDEADVVEDYAPDEHVCPHCRCELLDIGVRDRSYVEIEPIKPKKRLVHIHRRMCPECMKTFERKPTDVLPRVQIGNRLGAQCLYDHYVGGMTLGALARRLGLKRGSLASFEKVAANLLEKTIDRLTEEYRSARVKHADETTWRCDGRNGYAWGFFTDDLSIYRFRESRGSKVALDVFGEGRHRGVLVVDRYAGYNPAWLGRMQYCFEHLKRDGKDILEKGVKDEKERALLEELVECLRFAMTLRRRETGKAYDREARRIRNRILEIARTKVKDGAVAGYFDIFGKKRHRLFQWVAHPEVPAENNLAERRLRPLVIARKLSFGSQSTDGLRIRETLLTVMDTLRLRWEDPVEKLMEAFEAIAAKPETDVADILFPKKPAAGVGCLAERESAGVSRVRPIRTSTAV